MTGEETFSEMVEHYLDEVQHEWYMGNAMAFNELLIGVPYGPALCQLTSPRRRECEGR